MFLPKNTIIVQMAHKHLEKTCAPIQLKVKTAFVANLAKYAKENVAKFYSEKFAQKN